MAALCVSLQRTGVGQAATQRTSRKGGKMKRKIYRLWKRILEDAAIRHTIRLVNIIFAIFLYLLGILLPMPFLISILSDTGGWRIIIELVIIFVLFVFVIVPLIIVPIEFRILRALIKMWLKRDFQKIFGKKIELKEESLYGGYCEDYFDWLSGGNVLVYFHPSTDNLVEEVEKVLQEKGKKFLKIAGEISDSPELQKLKRDFWYAHLVAFLCGFKVKDHVKDYV